MARIFKGLTNKELIMAYGMAPTHWYTHDCEFCYKLSFISIEEEFDSDDRFCPNCGISSEINSIYEDDINDYDEDYED